jgi:hypothetical protein
MGSTSAIRMPRERTGAWDQHGHDERLTDFARLYFTNEAAAAFFERWLEPSDRGS